MCLRRLARFRQGRHADTLALLDTGRRFDPAPIDAQIALAAHLLDHALCHMRELPAEPAVEPLPAVARGDGDSLNPAH